MCELLEVCVPLCMCMFRTCQFGMIFIYGLISCVGECIQECCPNCCNKCLHKQQKLISVEDLRKDTVDSAWNENRPKHNQQNSAVIQQPSSSTVSHTAIISSEPKNNTMMGGWDDTPAANAVSSLDAGWNDNQLNLEQPCTEEAQLPSTETECHPQSVPSAPLEGADLSNFVISSANTTSINTVRSTQPSEAPATYDSGGFRAPSPPPSYEASQRD